MDKFMNAAHELGFDTVQSACGANCIPEVVSVEYQCIFPTPRATSCAPVDLRSGWAHSSPCDCAEGDTIINCDRNEGDPPPWDTTSRLHASIPNKWQWLSPAFEAILRHQRLRTLLQKRVRNNRPTVVFIAGLEGSGHHFWESVFSPCRRNHSTCAYSIRLSQLLYHKDEGGLFALEEEFAAKHASIESLKRWRTPREWERSLESAKAAVRTELRALKSNSDLRLIIVNNAQAPGSGLLSYPNYQGAMRPLHTPDVRLLAELCEIEGVDLRIIAL